MEKRSSTNLIVSGSIVSGKRGGEKKRERRGQGRRKGARGIREKAETSQ